jgi:hypothetical protein
MQSLSSLSKNSLGPSFQTVARIILISGTLAQVLLIKIIKGMRIMRKKIQGDRK